VYRCLSPIAISAGIYLDGSKNITVEGNDSYLNGVGISVGNEQDSSIGTGHLVKENTLYHNLGSGIYIGSNNFSSKVTNSVIKWNTIQNNYHIDSALYRRTQGRYGILNPANRWAEIVVNRAENITFEENEITSLSDIMSAFVFGQTGLVFRYNEYFTASNDPCNVYFVRDTTNDGVPDVFYNTFHMYAKKMNIDKTSTLGGVAYNASGCGTALLAAAPKEETLQVSSFPLQIALRCAYSNPKPVLFR
jgi:parallel beta-helix repeat protein